MPAATCCQGDQNLVGESGTQRRTEEGTGRKEIEKKKTTLISYQQISFSEVTEQLIFKLLVCSRAGCLSRGQSSAPLVATCPHVVGREGLVLQKDPVSGRRGSVEGELGISGHTGGTGVSEESGEIFKLPQKHQEGAANESSYHEEVQVDSQAVHQTHLVRFGTWKHETGCGTERQLKGKLLTDGWTD